ncbi:protein-tyrosine phosphatase family protein [Estrella lausannensis]|uniref:Protein-tyrosine phosphatase n=1 Tax=Estrella lausannensis TaxID=483423 RepID=A0A0H5DPE0_9BACT|nr:protein-tyrosine phosphatase family protein [Estrella lausannensis]CRX38287.1 Protein-tyrosine phosphatase [Estrella lausannensis]
MNGINVFNPFSNQYHALDDFKKLTVTQKIVTIALTALASIATAFLATSAVFRILVGHFIQVQKPHKLPEQPLDDQAPKTNKTPDAPIVPITPKTDISPLLPFPLDLEAMKPFKISTDKEEAALPFQQITDQMASQEHAKLAQKTWNNPVKMVDPNLYTIRWGDITSPEATHVPAIDVAGSMQHLHANYVNMEDGSRYIAIQYPSTKENDAFVQLVNNEASLIVDLTGANDRAKDVGLKFIERRYFPKTAGKTRHFKNMSVTCTEAQDLGKISVYTYAIVDGSGNLTKKIQRVHYKEWPDHGAIPPADVAELTAIVDKLSAGKPGAVMVHCRAGVGRTGTFITSRTLMHLTQAGQLTPKEYQAKAHQIILAGRVQRGPSFVQTAVQLKGIYQFGNELFKGNFAETAQSRIENALNGAPKKSTSSSDADIDGISLPRRTDLFSSPKVSSSKILFPSTPLPKPPVLAEATLFPGMLSDVKELAIKLGGSTGAKLVEADGKKYVRKEGNNAPHIVAEYYANKAYKVMGVDVPDVKLYNKTNSEAIKGNAQGVSYPVQLSTFVEGAETLKSYWNKASVAEKRELKEKIRRHFVLDVLLGNRDVIGASLDNILVTHDGLPIRIDNGSSFEFRAQGGIKAGGFSDEATEIDAMRNKAMNANAAQFFKGISDKEIIWQVEEIEQKFDSLLGAVPGKYHQALKNRLAYLKQYAANLIHQQQATHVSIDALLKNTSKTVVFDKNFSADGLSLNGVPFKKTEGIPDFSKVSDKMIGEPEFIPAPGKAISAGVIVVEADGRVWVYEPRKHFGGYNHTFPKGRLEDGYTMQQTALKEAFEESGLLVEIEGFFMDAVKSTTKTRYYLAKRIGGDPSQAHWEASAVKLATVDDLETLLNNGHDKPILNELKTKLALV